MKTIVTVHSNRFRVGDIVDIQERKYIVTQSQNDYIEIKKAKWYWKLWYKIKGWCN